jgi:hypothetical protein
LRLRDVAQVLLFLDRLIADILLQRCNRGFGPTGAGSAHDTICVGRRSEAVRKESDFRHKASNGKSSIMRSVHTPHNLITVPCPRLLWDPPLKATAIVAGVSRVLRRNEEARIYHGCGDQLRMRPGHITVGRPHRPVPVRNPLNAGVPPSGRRRREGSSPCRGGSPREAPGPV